ncbi:MAG TPA: PTS-dependent dihydroxyacetone kinase phosphotransferase subunit DhaM [Candidatus Agrococcus pullicola]|uniref:Phosphocarrier protein HPr n=1 Tax=Candidatus Agrococcus pullicola TaxID=2838429 RepID=A0A9D2C981_9MICO|nr:PTS-dependent dihydroxyacetone kinase phosphotransferase subunit DhaM [Candidatus Agrococcus pullicola]
MSIDLVIVSHSAKIAEGIVELAGQMAPDVRIHAVGGTDDGGIGTSFDRLEAAVANTEEAVVLCDLGSAVMTAETVIEFLDEDRQSQIRLADAPIVEGTIAAAVQAQTGGALAAVLDAAESARGSSAATTQDGVGVAVDDAPVAERTVRLTNEAGLHARPASELVKLAMTFESSVTVNGTDAKSLLKVMALGLSKGAEVSYRVEGPDALAAMDAIVALTESGFGE